VPRTAASKLSPIALCFTSPLATEVNFKFCFLIITFKNYIIVMELSVVNIELLSLVRLYFIDI
jgi:hypothetical protein